ncbi:ATPase, T2SS/T4P/T4SS family [Vreelandella rituensis]|uniref:Type II/IV secretion system protein n=1 Tax=Vreelandella rituensis TaxID=2282306 RepID=A0A368UDE9_9GAMM|nr:ATPase, T2SS/T4P/T4SS family [Halomonas rituensis]RCV93783.1 type II/IV secretion system protein [Halomonas rituensis]
MATLTESALQDSSIPMPVTNPGTAKQKLGDILLARGEITEMMLKVSLAEQRITQERLGKILIQNGFITQKVMIETIRDQDIKELSYESTLITRCPPELLLETSTMVLVEDRDAVFVASLSDEEWVRHALKPYYPGRRLRFSSVSIQEIDLYLNKLETMLSQQSSFAEKLLREALIAEVSDIHIEPRPKTYSIFIRRLGMTEHFHEGTLEEYRKLATSIKIKANVDISDRLNPQDGSYQVEHDSRMIDLRVATMPTIDGEKIVVRLLDPDSSQPSLKALGIANIEQWRKGISNSSGICLVCGPTGSGKTTTLNATIRELDRFGHTINTLEDPVEYRIPFVTQTNINYAIGLDFTSGVKALLRCDPDIIVVGEMRELGTAKQAIRAAETGHLVIGTLHADNIAGAFAHLRDMGIEAKEIRTLVKSVLIQRLVRTLCTPCGGRGCMECLDSGYAKRAVVSEIAYFDDPVQVDRAIEGEKHWPTIIEDAVEKAAAGVTRPDEVIRVFGEPGRQALIKRGYSELELGNPYA